MKEETNVDQVSTLSEEELRESLTKEIKLHETDLEKLRITHEELKAQLLMSPPHDAGTKDLLDELNRLEEQQKQKEQSLNVLKEQLEKQED